MVYSFLLWYRTYFGAIIKAESARIKISYIINDYLNVLRSDLLVDENLERYVRKIYAEHQDALDLILKPPW